MEENYINLFEQSIEEAYIGKTDTLLEIEKQFEEIKRNCKTGRDNSSSPEVQKLNRLVEKQFGMEIFCLKIETTGTNDCFTNNLGIYFDIIFNNRLKSLVTGSQDTGYRFKPNNHICVMTTMKLSFIKSNLTSEQLTGFLLHEIGHNFALFLDDKIRLANRKLTKSYYDYCVWRASLIFGRKYRKKLDKFTNKETSKEAQKLQKHSVVRGWLKGLASLKYNFTSFCKQILGLLASASYVPANMSPDQKKEMEDEIKVNIDRKDEVFADKFAAVYGYANDISKGLYKADLNDLDSKATRFVDKVFGQDIVTNFEALMSNYYLYDPHPHTIQRANSMIKTLKAELEKEDLDPKVKAAIKSQISQVEQFINEITTATKNESEREAVRKAFYKTVSEDSPDSLATELEKEIERELDEGLKKNK